MGGSIFEDKRVIYVMDNVFVEGYPHKNAVFIHDNGINKFRTLSSNDFMGKSSASAFGELSVSKLHPRVQLEFPYNIFSGLVNVTGSGIGYSITHSSPFAVVSTTGSNSYAHLYSDRILNYNAGQGALCRFTAIFTSGVANSLQLVGLGTRTDGLFFGYSGVNFGIFRYDNGTEYFIPQSSWNVTKFDGSDIPVVLDPTKGNVYQIRYQWLGFGQLSFFMENQLNGEFTPVHYIRYANQYTTTSIKNPSFPITVMAVNYANTGYLMVKSPSLGAFVEGEASVVNSNLYGITNTKSTVGLEFTNLVSIYNVTGINGFNNRGLVIPKRISVAAEGAKPIEVILIKNCGLTGSYIPYSLNQSIVGYDKSTTSINRTGALIMATVVGKTESKDFDISNLEIELAPSSSLTLAARATSTTSDISAAITWQESY